MRWTAVVGAGLVCLLAALCAAQDTAPPKKTRAVGTIEAINGETITLATDTGSEISVTVVPAARLVRMTPGQTDLKSAPAISLSEVQVGDRLLVSGIGSADGKSLTATTAILMKKADVAEKQQRERDEWRKNGIGGVVKSIDTAVGSITLSTGTLGAPGTTLVQVSKETIVRRYAPDSVKFDDAKPGTLDQIKPGDQLRARGTKSEDGKELAAAEIVSGTFRSIAGTVVSNDQGNNTITVTDLATGRPVTLKVSADSQVHKLPEMFAQRIAMRLKAATPSAPSEGQSAGTASGGHGVPAGGVAVLSHEPHDFQQLLSHLPAVAPSELGKGTAVMLVATEGTAQSPPAVIVLLSGVEPILTAASAKEASTLLSPWNLGGAIAGTGDVP
jgi:hypothetical protein